MLPWYVYEGHEPEVINNKDNTIYSFDIETTSYLILGDSIINGADYLDLSEEEREAAIPQACMYVWQFSINEDVYFGRTWQEFKKFLDRFEESSPFEKIVFVHNLSFEFQFLRSQFKIDSVISRKSRRLMKADLKDYKITFRCTYFMSNCSLAFLPSVYNLPVEKMVGDLDYDKIRTSKTSLTDKELDYCKYDCLVVYEYIKAELQNYETVFDIPMTSTGKVRKELQRITMRDKKWRCTVRDCINIKPSIYNLMVSAFAGGYTHANFIYTDEVIKDVDSYDETSAYPYVLVTEKFPMHEFKECNLRKKEDMISKFAYLLRVKFHNIRCKYYNNFISASKCFNIRKGKFDNGRIISAEEIDIPLTDIDFKFIYDTYNFESYEIVNAYYSKYQYLPEKFVKFILQKYINKTAFKGVAGKELEYALEKGKFNSIFGMTVTNMIRDEVEYDDVKGWSETALTNTDIFDKLCEEKRKGFLSFAWGVWTTAYARDNLLRRVIELDEQVIYCDTDSIKLVEGYDKSVFEKYNDSVIEKIRKVSDLRNIPFDSYAPFDRKGVRHMLGIFENETEGDREHTYDKFITQGAKKYAVEVDGEIKITVSGVPKKSGAKCLKRIEDFRDDLVFDGRITNKKIVMYNDNQRPVDLIDYNGVKYRVEDKSGCCLLPTTYKLGKAQEYADLLIENSSKRAKFNL